MREKLKSLVLSDHGFYSLLVILIGFGGYFLGYEDAKIQPAQAVPPSEAPKEDRARPREVIKEIKQDNELVAAVVASKSGSKYHLPNCPGASQIKADNLIEFGSIAEAEAAGYKPATNCPGLVQ